MRTWPQLGKFVSRALLALVVLLVLGLVVVGWIDRARPWSWLKCYGLLLNSVPISVGLWFFGVAFALLFKLQAAWRQTVSTPREYPDDGRTPLQRLEEEFDIAYPGRLNKEAPPEPVVPPPRDDNPYSYR